MDHRNLHIRLEHTLRRVQWDSLGGSEYFLVGDGETFDLEQVQSALNKHFTAETVLASPSRHEALVLERASAAEIVANHAMRAGAITVFDHDLSKFMQFTKIGVARRGQLAS